jgi:hypothetical protein
VQLALDPSLPEEPKERQQERRADEARQHPVRPLPPVDGLEVVEAHAEIAFAVLRNRVVLCELGLPAGGGERWQHAGHRFPFDDRQPRLREPRGPAHDQRREDERRHRQEPQPDGAAAGFGRMGGSGHAE